MNNITFIFSQAILRYGLTPFLFVIISSSLMIIITAILVYKEVKGVKVKDKKNNSNINLYISSTNIS